MLIRTCLIVMALLSSQVAAAQLTISEDVGVYMLAGPTTQYRIIGTVTVGDSVTALGETSGDYTKVEDNRGRQGWIKSSDLHQGASFRTLLPAAEQKIVELEQKLASNSADLQAQLKKANSDLSLLQARYDNDQQNSTEMLTEQRQRVSQQAQRINELEQQNQELNAALNSVQNTERFVMWKQGGMIAAGGLLLGLIVAYLPRPQRRRHHDKNYIR
ncbi:TIGR04211 family SH3 domain-containing protein [Ferrimonas senticii]|uniref:TIGR04211 family SH3 domain-containing protein n=1 Tax=Ferrimonas senticii TaxID=394566 RepID=UPI0003FEB0D7|nr:TIGR04211 family SH3 domain-containing protein [Ferrimonas senticii]